MADSELRAALQKARQGDRPTLDGFGLERVALASDQWRDTFAIDGAGRATLSMLRAHDARAVGEFAATLEEKDVQRLLATIERTAFDALKPAHAEPFAMRVTLSIVLAGRDYRWEMPAAPEAHAPITELLVEIDRLAAVVARSPVAAIDATLALDPPQPGTDERGVTVQLRNQGTEGTWIVNPLHFGPSDDEPNDHLVIRYGKQMPADPGAAPPPIIFATEDVTLLNAPPGRFLWVAAGATLVLRGRAAVAVRPGRYLFHAVYASYSVPAQVAGRRLFRGRVASPDTVLEVA
jgi:hypothetical protein